MILRSLDVRSRVLLLFRLVKFKVQKFRADSADHVLLKLELLVDKHSDFLGFHIQTVFCLHRNGVHHPDLAFVEANDTARLGELLVAYSLS